MARRPRSVAALCYGRRDTGGLALSSTPVHRNGVPLPPAQGHRGHSDIRRSPRRHPAPNCVPTLLGPGPMALQVEPRTAAAVTIQAWWRGQLVRRALLVADTSARRIQAWWQKVASQQQERQRLQVLVDYMRTERASVLLQAQVRAWAARAKYKRCQEAARTIQARWREHARRRAQGMAASGCAKDVDLLIEVILG
nr:IQ domain-containing protein F5-like [Anser cygnoides]